MIESLKQILVPIEFTEQSRNAFLYAVNLGKKLNWKIVVMHVFHPSESNQFLQVPQGSSYTKGVIQLLKKFAQDTFKEIPNNIQFVAKAGSPVDKIISTSKDFDLIIMSSRNYRNTFYRWLHNRTSNVGANANCPTLIVPINAPFKPVNNVWLIGRKENDLNAGKKVLKKLQLSDAAIFIQPLFQKMNLFYRLLSSIGFEISSKSSPELEQTTKEFILKNNIDLFCLVSHEKGNMEKFINDKSKQVAFKYDIPILICRNKK